MCETYEGKVDTLNYKTIRYPGHGRLMRFLMYELIMKNDKQQLEKILIIRFKKHSDLPKFKKLSERLEELRDKAEKGLITSIEFVKELCKLAKETLQAEKELEEEVQEKSPKAALTELFLELKSDQTPAVVERIVTDIDAIVRVV